MMRLVKDMVKSFKLDIIPKFYLIVSNEATYLILFSFSIPKLRYRPASLNLFSYNTYNVQAVLKLL